MNNVKINDIYFFTGNNVDRNESYFKDGKYSDPYVKNNKYNMNRILFELDSNKYKKLIEEIEYRMDESEYEDLTSFDVIQKEIEEKIKKLN